MRATAQDREASALMGIDVNRTISIAFHRRRRAGRRGGDDLRSITTTAPSFQMGFRYGLFAFTAAVLGGIGNLSGAVLGGFIIGLSLVVERRVFERVFPGWGAQWTPTADFRRAGHHDGLQAERLVRRTNRGQGVTMNATAASETNAPVADDEALQDARAAATRESAHRLGVVLLALFPFVDHALGLGTRRLAGKRSSSTSSWRWG